jgi:hypothetical protein
MEGKEDELSTTTRVLFYVTVRASQDLELVEEVANEAAHSIRPECRGKLRLGDFRKLASRGGRVLTGGLSTGPLSLEKEDGHIEEEEEDGGGVVEKEDGGVEFGLEGGGGGSGSGRSSKDGQQCAAASSSSSSSSFSFRVPPDYDYSKSTEENYAVREQSATTPTTTAAAAAAAAAATTTTPTTLHDREAAVFGPFAKHRATLDHSHHATYSRDRQALQDDIIRHFLSQGRQNNDNNNNDTPANPSFNAASNTVATNAAATTTTTSTAASPNDAPLWVVVTAGAMGAGKSRCMKWLAEKGHFPLEHVVQV